MQQNNIVNEKTFFKAAARDMRYFTRSKFSGILVHRKNFGLI